MCIVEHIARQYPQFTYSGDRQYAKIKKWSGEDLTPSLALGYSGNPSDVEPIQITERYNAARQLEVVECLRQNSRTRLNGSPRAGSVIHYFEAELWLKER
jgi:hypothetical protein